MSDELNGVEDTNTQENEYGRAGMKYHANISNLSPLAAVSIITLIGMVCVIIDFYLESE